MGKQDDEARVESYVRVYDARSLAWMLVNLENAVEGLRRGVKEGPWVVASRTSTNDGKFAFVSLEDDLRAAGVLSAELGWAFLFHDRAEADEAAKQYHPAIVVTLAEAPERCAS